MIVFIYGTTAEAIKLAPIARRLDERGIPYEHWLTQQHTDALRRTLPNLGFREPDRIIANGRRGAPLKSIPDALIWLAAVTRWLMRNGRKTRRSIPDHTVVLVHGDTMTSVVGTVIAKRIGADSAHVEAGLRSGNWRHPFPEELDRRMVGAMATIHYAPSEDAVQNLEGRKNVVYTHGNTIVDAVLDREPTPRPAEEKYGVVLLHRFELFNNRSLMEETIRALVEHSPILLKFVVDAYARAGTLAALEKTGATNFQVVSKVRHEEFIDLLRDADFVVSDSGGVQEETALLGIPTIIHRVATERSEGLGKNVVLSGWKTSLLVDFLASYQSHRRPTSPPAKSPSDVIVEDLIARGYAEQVAH